MVNGNYVLYGDRPSSESEIVDDHVHSRTVDRRNKRKVNRTANELQRTLNLAQLENDTDSVKYEKKVKEPRLLRYVPTTDVEEHFVTEKFETYDLKPTEEARPRRYAFTKKPKNPTDGSVNYAYSRSSSSCSSPNGNLPTISEHIEQYGTYRVRSVPSHTVDDVITGYESKLDKYFSKPREVKPFAAKGSHPDSLYRVADDNGAGAGNMSRVLRVLRWPVALLALCVALAVFVYFLMPDHLESSADTLKATVFEPASPDPPLQRDNRTAATTGPAQHPEEKDNTSDRGAKTSEIDFYDSENDKNDDLISVINPQRKLPIPPVFPTHITPEVQYGNERADSEIIRTPKVLDKSVILQENSTLKPQITQSPEKPLKLYFEDADEITSSTTSNPITSSTTISPTTETITRAETVNDYINYDMKQTTKRVEESPVKSHTSIYKEYAAPVFIHHLPPSLEETEVNIEQIDVKPELPPEIQEYYSRHPVDPIFTSGHSKLFGISIEDAKTMKSTTQSSLYNTRVSPTLPTWRDGDDTTTRKYPINIYTEVPQCDSTRLALCRGVLPYDLAGSAALVGGVELTSLMPQIEYLVASNCSDRVRHFLCALLEPECSPPPYPPKMPCYNLCKAIVDNCDGLIARELAAVFNCQNYAKSGCISAKAPCYQREFTCGDGSCVPRDWICDGTKDCPSAEDEASCIKCDINEFRCRSGGCILKRWRCDGYNDCPDGEDEDEDLCGPRDEHVPGDGHGEIGEESAGSAPAPAVRRPNRVQGGPHRYADTGRTGENDSSRELLVTSDSSNAFKRNFTRRPSLSRLSSYVRPAPQVPVEKINKDEPKKSKKPEPNKLVDRKETTTVTSILEHESVEDVNMGDLGFFDEFDKQGKELNTAAEKGPWLGVAPPPGLMRAPPTLNGQPAAPPAPTAQVSAPPTPAPHRPPTRFGNNMRKYETVIDGASLLKKAAKQMAAEEKEAENETGERNATSIDNEEFSGSMSAHASPCPSGELRCVDGRCITLAQLCDGTIDCTDHADEDNCYT